MKALHPADAVHSNVEPAQQVMRVRNRRGEYDTLDVNENQSKSRENSLINAEERLIMIE